MSQGKKLNLVIRSKGKDHEMHVKHPVYNLRYTLMTRCYNASPTDFPYYQGRGIKVFSDWITNQESFFQWCFDNGWENGLALDRINPDQDYTPENCQFISKKNNLEKMHRDRQMAGESAPNAKLKLEQVLEIKKLLDLGVTCVRISRDFGVSKSTVAAIKRGQNWSNV